MTYWSFIQSYCVILNSTCKLALYVCSAVLFSCSDAACLCSTRIWDCWLSDWPSNCLSCTCAPWRSASSVAFCRRRKHRGIQLEVLQVGRFRAHNWRFSPLEWVGLWASAAPSWPRGFPAATGSSPCHFRQEAWSLSTLPPAFVAVPRSSASPAGDAGSSSGANSCKCAKVRKASYTSEFLAELLVEAAWLLQPGLQSC